MSVSLILRLTIATALLSASAVPLNAKTMDDFVRLLTSNLDDAPRNQSIPRSGARFTDDGDLIWDDAAYSFHVVGSALNATHVTVAYEAKFNTSYANVISSGTTLSKGEITSRAAASVAFAYEFNNVTGTLSNGWISEVDYDNQNTVFWADGHVATVVPSLVKFMETYIDTTYDSVLLKVLMATSEEFNKLPPAPHHSAAGLPQFTANFLLSSFLFLIYASLTII